MRVIQSTVQRQLTTAETTDDPSDCNVYPYPFADSSAPNFPRSIIPHKKYDSRAIPGILPHNAVGDTIRTDHQSTDPAFLASVYFKLKH